MSSTSPSTSDRGSAARRPTYGLADATAAARSNASSLRMTSASLAPISASACNAAATSAASVGAPTFRPFAKRQLSPGAHASVDLNVSAGVTKTPASTVPCSIAAAMSFERGPIEWTASTAETTAAPIPASEIVGLCAIATRAALLFSTNQAARHPAAVSRSAATASETLDDGSPWNQWSNIGSKYAGSSFKIVEWRSTKWGADALSLAPERSALP
mmetsp:Transcript_23883/g.74621  ORF Transcript_23883/g.74621 Transcript_23883/m.74621 type:complete len:216 (-) Transcript_23883:378-1025(-)